MLLVDPGYRPKKGHVKTAPGLKYALLWTLNRKYRVKKLGRNSRTAQKSLESGRMTANVFLLILIGFVGAVYKSKLGRVMMELGQKNAPQST